MVVFHEAFHPFVSSSIHGLHHTWKKNLAKINNPPPPAHVLLSKKGMPGPGGEGTPKILISISTTNSTYILHIGVYLPSPVFYHGQLYVVISWVKAVQTSRFSVAKVPMNTCRMWYKKRFWKCSL